VQRRSALAGDRVTRTSVYTPGVRLGFGCALLYGAALSTVFMMGYESASTFMFGALIVLGLFRPIHRAECVLGFILGMTYHFGPVLPAVAASVMAALVAVQYHGMRPVLTALLYRLARPRATAGG
jgi:hypothetical protein